MRGLEAEGLSRRYGQRSVLLQVRLNVRPGERVGLLGPNGAGKTTCFEILAGLLAPHAGRVLLHGEDITGEPLYRRAQRGLVYVPQQSALLRGISAAENLRIVLELRGIPRQRLEREVLRALESMRLETVAEVPAESLSGGEQRRLALARALVLDPSILLLDEPFSGLDPVVVESLGVDLERLSAGGIGILLTDHNVHAGLPVCERVYLLHEGRILMSGTAAEAAEREEVRRVYLGRGFRPGG